MTRQTTTKPKRADNQVQAYLANALATATVSAYRSDLRHFRAWGGRIPATPEMVARYVADCAGLFKASTLSRRLAAISSAHLAQSKESPVRSDLVRRTMRGIQRVHGTTLKQAQPMTLAILRELSRPRFDVVRVRDLRDRALILLGFAGAFRRSELAGLMPTDLQFTRDGLIVTLRRSKVDPKGNGRAVAIPRGKGSICPVIALARWIQALRACDPGGAERPLFRRIDQHGNLGTRLSAGSIGPIVRSRLSLCGFDCKGVSAHSLRASLVTAAARAGAPTWAIQRQTGHRSERTVHRYVRGLTAFECNAFGAAVSLR